MLNQKVADQKKAAAGMGLQEAVKAAPVQPGGGATLGAVAGGVAAQQTATMGAADLAAQQATTQQALQAGQEGLQITQQQLEQKAQQRKLQRTQSINEKINTLSQLGEDVKQREFDAQLKFNKDTRGMQFATNNQLRDYAVLSAKSKQQALDRMQVMQQVSDRKIQTLQIVHRQLLTQYTTAKAGREQEVEQAHTKKLKRLAWEIEQQIAEEKARRGNNMAVARGVGTVVGAVGGAIIGWYAGGQVATGAAMGASAGAKAGEGLGTMYAAQQE